MHYKTTMRTKIKSVRYALDSFNTLAVGKALHPQDVEKYLRNLVEGKAADYVQGGHADVIEQAKGLLGNYNPDNYKGFLVNLAKANFHMAEKSIRHAATRGAIHKRTADRKVSRLAKALYAVESQA